MALKAWEAFIAETEPSVALCVCNKSDIAGSHVTDEQRDAWLNWCWEHGLEMVECSALNDEVHSEPRNSAHLHIHHHILLP